MQLIGVTKTNQSTLDLPTSQSLTVPSLDDAKTTDLVRPIRVLRVRQVDYPRSISAVLRVYGTQDIAAAVDNGSIRDG